MFSVLLLETRGLTILLRTLCIILVSYQIQVGEKLFDSRDTTRIVIKVYRRQVGIQHDEVGSMFVKLM